MFEAKSRLSRYFRILIAVVGCCFICAGCAGTHFGGRLVTVTLTSNSQDNKCIAFLVSAQKFNADPTIVTDVNRLDGLGHNYNKGPTPATVRILPQEWEYVAVRLSDKKISRPVQFNPDDLPIEKPSVVAEFDDVR